MKTAVLCAMLALVLSFDSRLALAQDSARPGTAPKVVNAASEQRVVKGTLESFFQEIVKQQTTPAWIAYTVQALPGQCIGYSNDGSVYFGGAPCGRTYLEGRPSGTATVKLEGDSNLMVLFRVENKQVTKLNLMSPESELDAGGLPFIVLTGVAAGDSVRLLAGYARQNDSDRIRRTATTAIGLHADAAATDVLIDIAKKETDTTLRRQAMRWLGERKDPRAVAFFEEVLKTR